MIKGGFEAKRYSALLQTIDRDIERISRLTTGTIVLGPVNVPKRDAAQHAHWQEVRKHAMGLFETLNSRLRPCGCQLYHQANLRLVVRDTASIRKDSTRFELLLSFDKPTISAQQLP